MSSIKPTTSARTAAERVALLALAAAALATAVISVREAQGAHARAIGLAATGEAEVMERGPVRDNLLDSAQASLSDALNVYGQDSSLWLAMARTRFLQATGAEITEVSPPLLEASAQAARRAEALNPLDYEAPARLAEAYGAWPNVDKGEGAAALGRSYARRPVDAHVARIESAALLWPNLDESVRAAALAEACIVARSGGAARIEAAAAIASAFADITQNAACAPDAGPQSPDSSPQIQP